MKNNILQIGIAFTLLVFLTLLTDPFMLWMPPMAAMGVLLVVTILLCIWGGFVMQERVHDEREMIHRMYAGRVAYLSGIAILTIGLVVESLAHHVDPWIAYALGVMVIAKVIAHTYSEKYH